MRLFYMVANFENDKDFFKALLEISQLINSIQELDVLLEKVMDIAVETLSAERGFILLKSSDTSKNISVKVARNITDGKIADITKISSSIVNQVLKKGEAVLSYNALEDERFSGSESIAIQKIISVACVPLKIKERLIGVIYVDNSTKVGRFTQESVDFLSTFANQAAIAIENAQFCQTLREENLILKKQMQRISQFPEIIGQSDSIKEVFNIVSSVLDSDVTVLVEGESGTGKELIARAIHYNGMRKDKPFLAFFCGALSENLLESELFGHTKGSFTGATQDKKGLFEVADGGTLFLDEIGDVSQSIQTKLLRVLQEGEIKRVGETKIRKVNVRIISATNKKLKVEIEKGNFREDLFYRLNVITIFMPPLRERKEDIPLLAHHFLDKFAGTAKKDLKGFTASALTALTKYNWQGNIRELENTIKRAVVLTKSKLIDSKDLKIHVPENELFESGVTLKEFNKRLVLKTLKEMGGNKTHAAKKLGVSRRWLQYQLKNDN